jgi:GntR family transcriptional regulator/MocR family aminotransferase
MRVVCRERRAALVDALERELGDRVTVSGDDAGMYLTVIFRRRVDDRAIALRAAAERLWAAPLSEAYAGESPRHGLILGYGGTAVERIPAAVARLRRVIEQTARASRRPTRR